MQKIIIIINYCMISNCSLLLLKDRPTFTCIQLVWSVLLVFILNGTFLRYVLPTQSDRKKHVSVALWTSQDLGLYMKFKMNGWNVDKTYDISWLFGGGKGPPHLEFRFVVHDLISTLPIVLQLLHFRHGM